ncbi:MAG: SH3 domain-containing protein [Acidimicrobiia bacterium]|nr:SH3 domain-containing protein [Acidimicrobiia bacterium]
MRRMIAILLTGSVIALAACGDDDGSTGSGTTVPDPATSTSGATTTTVPPDDGELPGEPFDLYPYADAELAVVGVATDDTLNVRSVPGSEGEVLFELEPLNTGVVATGQNRQLDDGTIWAEVTTDDRTGWANTSYLLQPGAVEDATAELFPDPADLPTAATMDDLAQTIADSMAGTEEPRPRITIVDGPIEGDLAEITLDVLGLPDDSVHGLRLHLFAEPTGGGYTLRTIERTALCGRGVDEASGFCV